MASVRHPSHPTGERSLGTASQQLGSLPAAGFDLGSFAAFEHSCNVERCRAMFDRVSKHVLDVRPIHEAALHHLVDGAGLHQEVEHCCVTPLDHRMKRVDAFHEFVAPFDNSLVMKGDVPVGLFITDLPQALVKVFEAGPNIAVIGAEPCEIDI